jgi:hypothetical protein
MQRLKLIAATTAAIGTLAVATPIAGADTQSPPTPANPWNNNVCLQIAMQGPWATLGPYGPLGDYGPLGSKSNQKNPASDCTSQSGSGLTGMFAMPGTTGMFGMPGMTGMFGS